MNNRFAIGDLWPCDWSPFRLQKLTFYKLIAIVLIFNDLQNDL
ncbi:hypothetical protein HMPREF3226_01379 [Prevotella corporis]|uniref:Uncharacterized protein n=1 Tax=Prevotella corporis TaxID=28128 RepID=A0A133Q9R7_9BACT|nr:hypothetical protein HMPREF3226_01379 [Prevotella corporis]